MWTEIYDERDGVRKDWALKQCKGEERKYMKCPHDVTKVLTNVGVERWGLFPDAASVNAVFRQCPAGA